MQVAAARLVDAGYTAIGIDHFAKPDDSLTIAAREGRLRRNFQGYSEDGADALIGLGASSISQLPQGYVQNIPATGEYRRQAEAGGLCTIRGVELSAEDRVRRRVIEAVMCEFRVDFARLDAEFGSVSDVVLCEARLLAAGDGRELVTFDGRVLELTDSGRIFARTVAAAFDTYLQTGKGRHSAAV